MLQFQAHFLRPKYRPDIDGLRAVAVLSVVAFHVFPNWLKGGFIGVDIFFVISGFLISSIIFENLDKGTFSFLEFYSRRIKRIFPALLLVLAASYILGWFILFPDEYKQLGKNIAAGAGFVSNFVLWREAGYFDKLAQTKPLLHLWSLGIEEQFYIIWPLLLWLAWKRKLNLMTVTILVAIISFCLNIIDINKDVIATFYFPQTRFWELSCGSLLAWFSLYKKHACTTLSLKVDGWLNKAVYRKSHTIDGTILANVLSFIGILLLVYGFWRIDKHLSFPGKWAVIPVISAVLIISAGTKSWFNRILLSNKVAVWFGLISFPLYLWHWPLLSFARIIEGKEPSGSMRITIVIFSIVLAWLVYRFVECPIRLGRGGKAKTITLVFLMLATGCIGYSSYSTEGLHFENKDREEFVNYFENSFPNWQYFKKVDLRSEWRAECSFYNVKKLLDEGRSTNAPVDEIDSSCYLRNLKYKKSILIWGDSHAHAIAPGINSCLPNDWQVLQVTSLDCVPNPNIDIPSNTNQCNQMNYFAIKTIMEVKPDVVIVAQANKHSAKMMKEISRKLEALGVKKIYFFGTNSSMDNRIA